MSRSRDTSTFRRISERGSSSADLTSIPKIVTEERGDTPRIDQVEELERGASRDDDDVVVVERTDGESVSPTWYEAPRGALG